MEWKYIAAIAILVTFVVISLGVGPLSLRPWVRPASGNIPTSDAS
jgi:hypothetical protein